MAIATDLVQGDVVLTADFTGNDPYNPELTPTGVTPGVYTVPELVVDGKGRCLNVISGDINDLGAVPNATPISKGIVQINDTYLNITAGVLTVDEPAVMSAITPGDATPASKGIVRIDDTYLDITAGILTLDAPAVLASGMLPDATTASKGNVQIDGTYLIINSGVLTVDHAALNSASSIPDATAIAKGIVQIGSGLDVTAGVVDLTTSSGFTTLGGIKSANTNNITITNGDVDTGVALPSLDVAQTWTSTQSSTPVNVLTDAVPSTIIPDGTAGTFFEYTIQANLTIDSIANPVIGATYTFILKQDLYGGHTVTLDPDYKFSSTDTVVAAGSNAISVLSVHVESATNFLCILQNNFI